MKTLAVYSSKGGVGKTITSVNLAALWAKTHRVLLIDLDAQYSATSFFLSDAPQECTIYDVLLENAPLESVARPTKLPGLHIAPSGEVMEAAARQIPDLVAADLRLSRALRHAGDYDLCILDCPSRYDAVARNALMSATHLLVPLNSERMAFSGAIDTAKRAIHIREEFDREALPTRVVLTAYRSSTINGSTIEEATEGSFPSAVCQTRIRATVKVQEMSTHWRTVADEGAGTAREDYTALKAELSTWMQLSP